MTLTAEQEKILHPVKHLRIAAGLTQVQLANRVSVATNQPMSEQWISRVEKGLMGEDTDLSAIFTTLYSIISVRHAEEGRASYKLLVEQLITDYLVEGGNWSVTAPLFVDTPKELINLSLSGSNASRNLALYRLTQDWYLVQRAVAKHFITRGGDVAWPEMTDWYTANDFMNTLLAQASGPSNPLSLSVYSFCMMLKLHPYTITRWLAAHRPESAPQPAGVAASWPDGLRAALQAMGYPWERVAFTGRDRRTSKVDPALEGSNND